MKKLMILIMLLLAGCAEKQEYENAVAEQLKSDTDIKDYHVDMQTMQDCVVHTTSGKMPGLFGYDPQRLTAYKNYAKMLKLNSSSDPKKTLEELRIEFGSPKELAEAHANYSESVMECMSGLVTSSEQELKKEEAK